eukprot:11290444-Alexandrium_andersonii.AAC.2
MSPQCTEPLPWCEDWWEGHSGWRRPDGTRDGIHQAPPTSCAPHYAAVNDLQYLAPPPPRRFEHPQICFACDA